MRFLKFFSIFFVLSVFQYAEANLMGEKTLYLGVGVISQNVGRLTASDTGSASLLTSNFTEIHLIADFDFLGSWHLSPMVGYTPLGRKSADSNEKAYLLPIAVRLSNSLGLFNFFGGPGILIYKISGEGGTATLNNGTTTAVFGLPSESVSSKLLMLDLGIDRNFSNFKLAAETMLTGLLSSRRAFNLMLSISYGVL